MMMFKSDINLPLIDPVILAGGFGTRLKDAVPDLPKPELQSQVSRALSHLLYVLARFDDSGSQIIYHSLEGEY